MINMTYFLKNFYQTLKSEFLADPAITWPELADSFLSRALPTSLFQILVALNTYFNPNISIWCQKQ